jgi:hypothetical protein
MESNKPNESKPSWCSVWQQVLSDVAAGKQPSVAVSPEASLSLVDHIEECDACLNASQKADTQHRAALYEFLARLGGEISGQDNSYLEKVIARLSDEEQAIEATVTQVLLPGLHVDLREEYNRHKGSLSPLALFAATEAVALMLTRVMRERGLETIRLTETGEIRDQRELLVSKEALAAEVQDFAEVPEDQAAWLSRWICQAAHFNPRLFLGLSVIDWNEHYVTLKREARRNVMELRDWWKPLVFGAGQASKSIP